MSKESGNSYSPSARGELERLQIQADFARRIDQLLFNKALADMPENPLVIDIGCAQGYLTRERFSGPEFGPVVGVDIDKKAIGSSIQDLPKDWSFIVASIEDDDFDQTIKDILKNTDNGDKPVFVFLAYVLMHLDKPIEALEKLYSVLPKGSKIVVRTADDDLGIGYPVNGGLNSIIYPSVVNPLGGDRNHGRKLYYQLHQSGWRNIEIFIDPTMTPNLNADERQAMFEINYSWRADGLIDKVNSGKASSSERQELSAIQKSLSKLESDIQNPDYFLLFLVIGAVAEIT